MGFLTPDIITLSVSLAFLVSFLDEFEWVRKWGKPFSCPLCLAFWVCLIMEATVILYNGGTLINAKLLNAFVASPISLMLYLIVEKLDL